MGEPTMPNAGDLAFQGENKENTTPIEWPDDLDLPPEALEMLPKELVNGEHIEFDNMGQTNKNSERTAIIRAEREGVEVMIKYHFIYDKDNGRLKNILIVNKGYRDFVDKYEERFGGRQYYGVEYDKKGVEGIQRQKFPDMKI
jgi:hypothetical protein